MAEIQGGPRTSEILLELVKGEGESVSVKELLGALAARGFGLAVLVFSIPSIVPMPPGVPTLVGVALLIVSAQMIVGRRQLWLPRILADRALPRSKLRAAFERIQPVLRRIERVTTPRVVFLTGRLGAGLVGVVVLIMAIILILPLPPGGNFPPALAAAALGMGLAERDGFFVLAGLIAAVAALAAVWVVTISFIRHVPATLDLVSLPAIP